MIGVSDRKFGLLIGGAMVQLNGAQVLVAPFEFREPGLKLWHRFFGQRVFKLLTMPRSQIQSGRQKRAGHGLGDLAIAGDDKSKIAQARNYIRCGSLIQIWDKALGPFCFTMQRHLQKPFVRFAFLDAPTWQSYCQIPGL
jgi:hypothetical protein